MAKLYYIYGTMNASKSTELILKAHQFLENNIPCLCFKSAIDTRSDTGKIESRTGLSQECVDINQDDDMYNILKKYLNKMDEMFCQYPKWILIDESQFLTKKQVEELSLIVDEMGINVICYGLRTDFTTNLFEGSKRLLELADSIKEIPSSCRCGNKAIINARISNNGIVTTGDKIFIGGNAEYVPLCRKCYNELIKKQSTNN